MSKKTFVDCHCHLFNMMDIPLYATLEGNVHMGTLKRLLGSFAGGAAFLSGKLGKEICHLEEFVRFFERDIESNAIWLAKEVQRAKVLKAKKFDSFLLTPLIMDFDLIDYDHRCKTKPLVEKQTDRLITALDHVKDQIGPVKFCPFLGLDLRKLEMEETLPKLKKAWKKYGQTDSERKKGLNGLKNGKVIGIKLYPPLGFNPYPKGSIKNKYLEFYEWCCKKQIPITVHCQEGSYSSGGSSRLLKQNTRPENWLKLFKNNPKLRELKINFAHFGGDEGFEDLFEVYKKDGIDRSCWAKTIIDLLLEYPNTFADLSAYNFADKRSKMNFRLLLEKDAKGMFQSGSSEFKLTDKLLWGSDVPMILSEPYNQVKLNLRHKRVSREVNEFSYEKLFFNYKKAVDNAKKLNEGDRRNIIYKMTSINPEKFLSMKTD